MQSQLTIVGEFRTPKIAGELEFVPSPQQVALHELLGENGDEAPELLESLALAFLTGQIQDGGLLISLLDGNGGVWNLAPHAFPFHLPACLLQVHAVSGQAGPVRLLVAIDPKTWEREEDRMCNLFAAQVYESLGPTGYLPIFRNALLPPGRFCSAWSN